MMLSLHSRSQIERKKERSREELIKLNPILNWIFGLDFFLFDLLFIVVVEIIQLSRVKWQTNQKSIKKKRVLLFQAIEVKHHIQIKINIISAFIDLHAWPSVRSFFLVDFMHQPPSTPTKDQIKGSVCSFKLHWDWFSLVVG